ncbi:MAG TPA: hypothetical protein PKO07_15165 [Pseudomonadota bacterium]|jgi:hypothetical protein|nr:hypothetical protein [Pseudomonadota bacterium]HNF98152.1 hypothetical protein [Pseudomonadota bacterium]HNN52368.1 hypothetical protein [Pseudomonadota bacterium]
MAQVIVPRAPDAPDVYCYNTPTDADEVNATLHDLVRTNKMSKNIWVISGTHGMANGTVDAACRETDFKSEDLDSANGTSKQIHIKDYHLLSSNTWKTLREKAGATNILVLAFCYSEQWFWNSGVGGNDGKL